MVWSSYRECCCQKEVRVHIIKEGFVFSFGRSIWGGPKPMLAPKRRKQCCATWKEVLTHLWHTYGNQGTWILVPILPLLSCALRKSPSYFVAQCYQFIMKCVQLHGPQIFFFLSINSHWWSLPIIWEMPEMTL